MRVAVIGFGVGGRAAVEYWRAAGDEVVVHERGGPVEVPVGVAVAGGYLSGLDSVDLIVRSPGVRPDTLPADVLVTSVIAEFMARCPVPVIGVKHHITGLGVLCGVGDQVGRRCRPRGALPTALS